MSLEPSAAQPVVNVTAAYAALDAERRAAFDDANGTRSDFSLQVAAAVASEVSRGARLRAAAGAPCSSPEPGSARRGGCRLSPALRPPATSHV